LLHALNVGTIEHALKNTVRTEIRVHLTIFHIATGHERSKARLHSQKAYKLIAIKHVYTTPLRKTSRNQVVLLGKPASKRNVQKHKLVACTTWVKLELAKKCTLMYTNVEYMYCVGVNAQVAKHMSKQ